MINFIKSVFYNATIAIALSLYSQSISAGQLLLSHETQSVLSDSQTEPRKAYSVYHSGKLQPLSDLSEKPTLSSEKFIPMSERRVILLKNIEVLTEAMDARSKEIDAITKSIADIVKKAESVKTAKDERLARKTSPKFTSKQTAALKKDEDELNKLATQKIEFGKRLQLLQDEQTKDGRQRLLAQDSLRCTQVSELMGSYSYLNKSPSQSATWRQLLGAVPEGILSCAATFLNPVADIVLGIDTVLENVGEKIEKEGVVSYASSVAKETFEAVKNDPLSAIILPGAMALNYADMGEFARFCAFMGVGTANGIKNSQILYDLAAAIEADSRASQFVKYMILGGALYYFVTSIPGTEAAVINYGSEFLIGTGTGSLPATSSSGNTVSVVWGNSTHVNQAFYDQTTGTRVAGPFVLNSNPTSTGNNPTSVFLDSSTVATAWVSAGSQIDARLSSTSGPSGSVVTLNQVVTGIHGDPSIVPMGSNKFFAAWHADVGTHFEIKFGTFDASTLASVSGDLTMNAATSLSQFTPQCELITNIVCSWGGTTAGGSLAPVGRIMSIADGTTFVTGQFTINPAIAGTDQIFPVPINLGGNPFFYWINGADVSGVATTSAGVPSSAVIKFNVNSALGQTARIGATQTTDGTGIVVWGGKIGAANTAIYQSSISPALTVLESETKISTGTNTISRPSIVQIPGGGVFDTWNGNNGVDVGFLGTIGRTPGSTTAPTVSQSPSTTTAPTVSQSPSSTTAPTVSQSPSTTVAPTVSQSPSTTSAPTSGGSSLTPGFISLPFMLSYHAIATAANIAGNFYGKLFG